MPSPPRRPARPWLLLAMKRVYGGRLWPRLLRAGLVTTLYGTTLLLALAAVAVITLLP